ncbi:MAG: hypothetical protein KBT73_07335 [Marinobacter sp.]|uniref:hypothetical protein n=1 Tax=uncultured Marinobacter sp. TaxID=187379 RepID=UPI001B77EDF5|nr:hypothetical protein [Marinobacter sp.]|tara:strand:- start:64 stop:216 length:153 start_codon:yes stop_codon:yes gene_type:complete
MDELHYQPAYQWMAMSEVREKMLAWQDFRFRTDSGVTKNPSNSYYSHCNP